MFGNRERLAGDQNFGGFGGGGPAPIDFNQFSGPEGVEGVEFAGNADRQAKLQQGAMQGLRADMASRGLGGAGAGGVESALAQNIRGESTQQLSDLIRQQQQDSFARGGQVADRNLAASLTQRGQDVTQRGQDAAARNAMLGLIFGGGGLY